MNTKTTKIIIFVLAILLIVLIIYVLIDKYQEKRDSALLNTFQQGSQFGYEQAIIRLINEASTCTPIPVFYNNQTVNITVNLIDVRCLQIQNQTR